MWPGKSVKLFCLLKCLMTQILSVSRCGWSWSPVMISSSRNVHPSSHTRVSLLSNGERPCMCVTCVSWEISPKLIWTWPSGIRWRRKRLCAHFLLWELQNYSLLLNSHRLENAGSHKKKKKDTPCPRAKENPQQICRRGEISFRLKPLIHQRCSEGSNKPCVHQDPEMPQRLSQNCVWVSPVEVWVSSGLPQGQGLWVQQTWVWHKPSGRRSPFNPTVEPPQSHWLLWWLRW